jgi:hypothetical protein
MCTGSQTQIFKFSPTRLTGVPAPAEGPQPSRELSRTTNVEKKGIFFNTITLSFIGHHDACRKLLQVRLAGRQIELNHGQFESARAQIAAIWPASNNLRCQRSRVF